MKTLYLDLFSGISGDMFLGALLDLGLDAHALEHSLEKLQLEGYHLHVSRGQKSNIAGTKFDVHRSAQDVRVAVLEGVVEVFHPDDPPSGQAAEARNSIKTIVAGQELVAPLHGSLARVQAVALPQPETWRSLRLSYDGATLREVVADANRYYPPGVAIDSPDIDDLKVTMSYRPSQVDEMVDTLRLALPIDVRRENSGRLVLSRRR